LGIFSLSESKLLKSILKKPEENFEKVVSLMENKIQEFSTELESLEKKTKESERKSRGFVNNISDIIYELDKNGKCSYVSHQLLDVSGFSPEEMIGQNVFKFVHPEDLTKVAEEVKIAFNSEDNRYIEFRLRHKNGHYVPVSSRFISKTFGEKKTLTGVLVDITESKKAEQKLKESEERFKYLVSSNPAVIYTSKITGDYGATFISDNVVRLWDFEPKNFIENSEFWLDHIHPDDKEPVVSILSELSHKDHIIYDYRFKIRNDTYRWMRDEVFLIRDDKGNPKETIGSVIDITDRKFSELKLKESEEKYQILFENSPISMMDQDLSAIKIYIDHLKASGINDFNKYFNDKPDELLKIMGKPKIIDVNKKTIEIYKAKSKEDFISHTNQLRDTIDISMSEGVFFYNKMQILSLINGDQNYDSEFETQTFNGDSIHLYAKTSIVSGFESTWSKVIVSIVDITDRKKIEENLKESEEKYRTLFESSPFGITLLNSSGIVVDTNSATELIGYSREDMIGKQFKDLLFVPKEFLPGIVDHFKQLIKTGSSKPNEIQLIRKDGNRVWINVDSTEVKVDNQTFYLIMSQNISNIKKVEQELKESEEKYRALFENAPIGVALTDYEGNAIEINDFMKKLLGYEVKELKTLGVLATYANDQDRIPFKNQLEVHGYIKDYEANLKKKDGKIFPALINSIKTNILEKPIYITTIKDISEKKEIEEIKTHLLTRFSHEFKTPLISIMGFSEFLLSEYKNKLDEKMIGFLEKIKEGGDRLKLLVNTFIQSSHLGENLTQLKKDKENLSDLIKLGVSEMQGIIHLRKHTIKIDIPEKLIGEFDKDKIYSVIINLLLNAINYTPPEGKIFIHSKIEKENIFFSIKDNGIGLTEDDKRHLFKPFGKIDKYGKGWDVVSEGMGVGLYLSKEIINLHGGKIWAESMGRNKGSTFYFSLPII